MTKDFPLKLPTCPYCSRQIAQDVVDNVATYDTDFIKWYCFCGKEFFTTTIMRFITVREQKQTTAEKGR